MYNPKRIKYFTMNSWNRSTAPAYNLKIHNIPEKDIREKVYELMECEDFYFPINDLMREFDINNDYNWQAGFNGRSGGYLVLYKGGKETKFLTEKDFNNKEYGNRIYISDRYSWNSLEEARKKNLLNREITTKTFTYPGKEIDEKEVPTEVLKDFHQLALDIIRTVYDMAKNASIETEEYQVTKSRKVINY